MGNRFSGHRFIFAAACICLFAGGMYIKASQSNLVGSLQVAQTTPEDLWCTYSTSPCECKKNLGGGYNCAYETHSACLGDCIDLYGEGGGPDCTDLTDAENPDTDLNDPKYFQECDDHTDCSSDPRVIDGVCYLNTGTCICQDVDGGVCDVTGTTPEMCGEEEDEEEEDEEELPICGNGVIETGEECDDEGLAPGDGCDEVCQLESECGNGSIDPGEDCDPGPEIFSDPIEAGCPADCKGVCPLPEEGDSEYPGDDFVSLPQSSLVAQLLSPIDECRAKGGDPIVIPVIIPAKMCLCVCKKPKGWIQDDAGNWECKMCPEDQILNDEGKCEEITCPETEDRSGVSAYCRSMCRDKYGSDHEQMELCVTKCVCTCDSGDAAAAEECFRECARNEGPFDHCVAGDPPLDYDEAQCCRGRCINRYCPEQEEDDDTGGQPAPNCTPPPICPLGFTTFCPDGITIQSITTYTITLACQCLAVVINVNPECIGGTGPGPGSGPGSPGPGSGPGSPGPGPGPGSPGPGPGSPGPGGGPAPAPAPSPQTHAHLSGPFAKQENSQYIKPLNPCALHPAIQEL